MTTDKTLGDHGLSAVTNQDCAVWRVINDEEICRDYEPGDSPVMVANANSDATKAPEELSPTVGLENSLVDADDMNLVGAPEIETASLKPIDAPTKPTIISAIEEDPIVPTLPTAENTRTDEPSPTPTAVKISGGTFFVIASFSRISGAKHFARRHAALAMQVFTGTAKGKTVYRIATGPVDKTQRPTVRGKLIDVGFDDVWALKLKAPKVVVELEPVPNLFASDKARRRHGAVSHPVVGKALIFSTPLPDFRIKSRMKTDPSSTPGTRKTSRIHTG